MNPTKHFTRMVTGIEGLDPSKFSHDRPHLHEVKALYRRAQARMGPASAVDTDRDAAIQDAGSHGMVRLVVVET